MWFEWFPDPEHLVGGAIAGPLALPGDLVQINVVVGNVSGTGSVIFYNLTRNQQANMAILNPTKAVLVGNCVEWIVERPRWNGNLTSLANFVLLDVEVDAYDGANYFDLANTNGGTLINYEMMSSDYSRTLCKSNISPTGVTGHCNTTTFQFFGSN